MATQKRKTTTTARKGKSPVSTSRKKTAASKKQVTSGRKKTGSRKNSSSPVSREISSIILAASGIFVFFSMYFVNITGFLGAPVKTFFVGMFGIGAYILPLIVITLSVFSLINREFKPTSIKVIQCSAIFISFLVFMHLLSFDGNTDYSSAISYVDMYYERGSAGNGGLAGAAFGNVLLSIFGKFGAYLIVIIVFITIGMIMTGKSAISAIMGLYTEIKERLEEAGAYEYEDEDEDEDEDEAEYEEAPRKPRKYAGASKKPTAGVRGVRETKTRYPRNQARFELPPVTNANRSRPPNFVIENRRKVSDPSGPSGSSDPSGPSGPSIEDNILIFNKAEKTLKKPILMPPTRKLVDVLTLNAPASPKNHDIANTSDSDMEDDYSIFEGGSGRKKEEVFVETPLIRHYARKSFTQDVPFSDGGRYKYPEAHTPKIFSKEFEESGYIARDEASIANTDYYDDPEDSDNNNDATDYDPPDPGYSYDSTDTDYGDYDGYNPDSGYDSLIPNTDYDNDTADIPEATAEDSDTPSDYTDDFSKMISDAYEQKLAEQELNALMLAKTGPIPVVNQQPTEPEPIPVKEKPLPAPTQHLPAPSPMLLSPRKPPDKGVPITVIHEDYSFPSIELLNKVPLNLSSVSRSQILETSRKLEETLKSFGVEAKVIEVSKGPTVTRYELFPGAGVKVRKISDLGNDLALNLAAESIRIEAPIPGKAAVGIEIPNKEVTPVYLREVIDDEMFINYPSKLAFALGKDITGNTVVTDIAKMPHLLIAGATGSGKSVCINTLITSLIYKADPNEVKLVMIDPKVVELSIYNGIPHLLIPVVTEPKKAAGALNWAVQEMLARYNAFAETSVRDLKGYNAYIRERGDGDTLPQIVIIIDELADLMMAAPGEVEDAICRLAQMARAAGLHLIIATQRPSVDVITGVIKANIPSRLAFSVSSGTDSRTILDMVGAEKLLGKGDMLFCPMGTSKPTRVQGAFITDKEVESIVNFVKSGREHIYDNDVLAKISAPKGIGDTSDELDEFFDDAIEFIIQKEKASASMLQRQFRIGYNRASRLIEDFEMRGIVGAEDGSKPRKVLMTSMQFEEYKQNKQ